VIRIAYTHTGQSAYASAALRERMTRGGQSDNWRLGQNHISAGAVARVYVQYHRTIVVVAVKRSKHSVRGTRGATLGCTRGNAEKELCDEWGH